MAVSGMRAVLDTNIVLYLLGGRLANPLPIGEFFISVITEMEILSYPALAQAEETRVRLFLTQLTVIGLDENIKNDAIALRKKYRLKLPDAIVSATALATGMTLLSNDVQLARVTEIQVNRVDIL